MVDYVVFFERVKNPVQAELVAPTDNLLMVNRYKSKRTDWIAQRVVDRPAYFNLRKGRISNIFETKNGNKTKIYYSVPAELIEGSPDWEPIKVQLTKSQIAEKFGLGIDTFEIV